MPFFSRASHKESAAESTVEARVAQRTSSVFDWLFFIIPGVLLIVDLALTGSVHWLNVSLSLQSSTSQALLVAAIGIPLITVTTGLRGILEAYEDIRMVNLLRIVLGAANFGVSALSVMLLGPSLVGMVVGLFYAVGIFRC